MSSKAPKKTSFETKTCSRCGGSGSYSYNQIDGSRCYGCGGSGLQYTKRGAIAKVKYQEMRKILPENAKVGDRLVQDLFFNSVKFTIAEILPESVSGYTRTKDGAEITTIHCKFKSVSGKEYFMQKGVPVEKLPSPEENALMLEECIKYQFSLTKAGTERKRGEMSEEDAKAMQAALEGIGK